jgi:hypothetical protein
MNTTEQPDLPAKGQFLVYQTEDGQVKINVRLQGETAWLTQAHLAALFQTTVPNVNMHLRNIFAEGELQAGSVIQEFLITAADGKNYRTNHYNLDAIPGWYGIAPLVLRKAECVRTRTNHRRQRDGDSGDVMMNQPSFIASVPVPSANGAASYQPGVTPQVTIHSSHLGPKARPIAAIYGSDRGLASPRLNGPSALNFVVRSIPGALPQAGIGSQRWCSERRNARDLEQTIAANMSEILEP